MKVTNLHLTEALFVPGLKQFNQTITPQHYPGIEMKLCELGVLVRFQNVLFIVPSTNIKCIVLSEEQQVQP